jgi:hypothetical protein
MTPDEIKKKLRDAGIPVDGWGETVEGDVKSPVLERQKEALGKVEVIIQRQLEEDQRKMAELHAVLQRLKHGGGM